jgi:hypothetical protein
MRLELHYRSDIDLSQPAMQVQIRSEAPLRHGDHQAATLAPPLPVAARPRSACCSRRRAENCAESAPFPGRPIGGRAISAAMAGGRAISAPHFRVGLG